MAQIRRPSVGRFEAELDELQDKLDEIAVLYRRVARDTTDPRDRDRHDAGRISGGDFSDPVGSVVVEHEFSRSLLIRTRKKVEGMARSADEMLNRLLAFYDPAEPETLRRFTTADQDAVEAQNRARRQQEDEVRAAKRQRLEGRLRRLRRVG